MGRLVIVRHGETAWNAEGRIQGHSDIELSERGVLQARAVAKRLAGTHIDAAYSSDLVRASDTAKMILEDRDVALSQNHLLRERYYGVFEGLTVDERRDQFPAMFQASLVKDLDFAPTGGESSRQTLIRIGPFVTEIKARHLDETVLLVGHGGSLRAAILALMEFPAEATWRFVMGNCGLTIIDTYSDNAVFRLYNDTSHLNGLGTESVPALGGNSAITGHVPV
jgi:broad specificity phosphatase PhoE